MIVDFVPIIAAFDWVGPAGIVMRIFLIAWLTAMGSFVGSFANVVVYLYLRGKTAPVHESYSETADAKVTLDNDKCRFEPHVCLLRTSQTLVVGNKDDVGHNTKIDTRDMISIAQWWDRFD